MHCNAASANAQPAKALSIVNYPLSIVTAFAVLLCLLFGGTAWGQQTNTLLTEGFESSTLNTSYQASAWYSYKTGNGNNWTFGNMAAHNGSKCAYYSYSTYYAADCYIVSMPFSVNANMTELSVSLFEKVAGSNYPETFEVFFVKASDVTTDAAVASATHYSAIASAPYTNDGSWAEQTGSTTSSALKGQSVRVVIHCTSATNMWRLYIDDLTVTETTASSSCPTTIATRSDWNTFCNCVNNGHDYAGETVTLTADVAGIANMAGTSSSKPFKGTFDGGGHTLTVAIIGDGTQGQAPFQYIQGATIKNLVVSGTVTATAYHAAGLVGFAWSGTNTIQNCLVHTNVNSSNNGHIGGIVGHMKNSTVVMTGCVYDGQLTSSNWKGGLIGWANDGISTTIQLTNCLFNGTVSSATDNLHPIGCANSGGTLNTEGFVTNCYYHATNGITSQMGDDLQQSIVQISIGKGKRAYTVTGVSPVTVDMSGTPTTYNVSGITAYSTGIKYDGTIYGGSGDNLPLSLSGSSTGYSADHGTLSGSSNPYTLVMEAYNTRISAVASGGEDCNTEDFSTYNAVTYNATSGCELPSGWMGYSSGNYKPHVSNNNVLGTSYDIVGIYAAGSTDNFLYMIGNATSPYASYTILPQYSNLVSFQFKYACESSSYGTLTVGYCTSNTSGDTFTAFNDITTSTTNTSTTINLTQADIDIVNNNNGYITFKWVYSASLGVAIDDVKVCTTTPSGPTYTVSTVIHPTAGGSATGAGSYAQGASCTLAATANTGYQFVNWTASDGSVVSSNANYTFSVIGDVTYQANFTKTTATPLPWTEGFEGYTVTSGNWQYLNGEWATPTRWKKAPSVCYYTAAAYQGNRSLEFRAASETNVVVLPQFNEPLNNLIVSFQIGRGNTASGYTVKLGYVTDPSNPSTFTELTDVSTPSGAVPAHTQFTYDLSTNSNSPSSSSYRLAIKYTTTNMEDSWYLDDFNVRVANYIATPSVTSTCGTEEFTISVSPAGSTYQWQYKSGSNDWASLSSASSSTGAAPLYGEGGYSGANSQTITINSHPANVSNVQWRCLVNGVASNAVTVNYHSRPSVSITDGNSSAKCSGTTHQLTANVSSGTTPYTTYSWSATSEPSGTTSGLTPANSSSINVTPTNTNTNATAVRYRVSVTDNAGCANTATIDITVKRNPSPVFTPDAITLSVGDTYDATTAVHFSDDGCSSPSWATSNGSIASVSAGTVTAESAGSATITVTYAETTNYCAASAELNVNVLASCPNVEVLGQSSSTNYYLPSYYYYSYSLSEQIYTPCEIGKSGEINSISFYSSAATSRKFDIYLVHTDKTSFSSTSDWILVTSADKVLSGGDITMNAAGWTTIYFDTPFQYDGVHNLAVVIDNNRGSSSTSSTFNTYAAEGNQSLYIYGSTNYDPTNITSTGTTSSSKNQIKFGICDQQTLAVPTITEVTSTAGNSPVCGGYETTLEVVASNVGSSPSYAWSNDAGSTATVTIRPESTTNYIVTVTASETGCSATASKAVSVVTSPTITASPDPAATCLNGTTQLVMTAANMVSCNASDYTFTRTTGTYTELSSPTTILAPTTDDADPLTSSIATFPDGFKFKYCGIEYTGIYIYDGVLRFASSSMTYSNSAMLSSTTYYNMLAPFCSDLYLKANTGTITYKLTGTAPNRVLTIQFKNITTFNDNSTTNYFNFQVKLYENGQIEFCYGSGFNTINAYYSYAYTCIGINNYDGLATHYHQITPTDGGATDQTSGTLTSLTVGQAHYITNGTIYRFTPPQPPSFAWTYTGSAGVASTTSITNDTYTVTPAAATNTYTVTNTETGCSRTETIDILTAANIAVTSSAATCGVPLDIVAGGFSEAATYGWYSDESCTSVLSPTDTYTVNSNMNTANATYYVQVSEPSEAAVVETRTFEYTGSPQSYSIPAGTDFVKLEVWGAQGGGRPFVSNTAAGIGGKGGYSVGTLTNLSGVSSLNVYVGGHGLSTGDGTGRGDGGWNGGGCAYTSETTDPANGGGGATDIRLNGNTYYYRIIVAGGGGGGGEDSEAGGYGGGETATDGTYTATQTSAGTGGAFGQGAHSAYDGGGAGGGWYGGGSEGGTQTIPTSNYNGDNHGGCGGSGYVWTSSTSSSAPSGYSVSSSYYLTDAQTIAGNAEMPNPDGGTMTGREGNGYARITCYRYTYCTAKKPVAVTINKPSVSIPNLSAQTICSNESFVELDATPTTINGTPSYQWSQDGNTITNTNATYTPTEAGTYAVTVTSTVGTCTAKQNTSAALAINSPSVSIPSLSAQTICSYEDFDDLDVTPTSNNGTLSYSWSKDNVGFTNNSATYSPTTAGTYAVTVTSTVGTCTAKQNTSATLAINSSSVSITTGLANTEVCEGSAINFSTTATGAGTLSYQWQHDGSDVGTNSSSYSDATASVSDAGTYAVTVTSTVGTCTAKQNTSASLIVNTAPTAPTSISGSNICLGNNTELSVLGGTEGDGSTYQWGTGTTVGENTISGNTSTITVTPTETTTYWVRRVGNTACVNNTDGVTKQITVNTPNPSASGTYDYIWRGGTADWNTSSNWYMYSAGNYSVASGEMPATAKNYYIGTGDCLPSGQWPTLSADATVGNVTIDGGSVTIPANKTLSIAGSVNGTLTAQDNSTIEFVGSDDQTLSDAATFSNVTVAQTVAGKKIIAPNGIAVNGLATFGTGVVSANVSFGGSASATGASLTSYVDGTVTKTLGSSDFTFPTGSNGVLGSVTVPATRAGGSATIRFNKAASEHGYTTDEGYPRWWNINDMCSEDGNNRFDHVSNAEYWDISTSADLSGVTLRSLGATDVHFNNSVANSYDANDIKVAVYNGCWKNIGGTASVSNDHTEISVSGITLRAVRSGGYKTTFGSLVDNTVLPIELLSFTATCDGRSSLIEWTTATEKNNDYFSLERSDDAVNFTELARVAGAGNSIAPIVYAYTDYGVHGGDNYYRLVQVDYDGTRTVSEIVVANCIEPEVGEPDVQAYPNPFNGELTLELDNFGNRPARIEVYDMLGKLIYTDKVAAPQNYYETILNLSNLPPAAYTVRVSTNDFVINRNVVKQ